MQLRPMELSDLALVERWLTEPHVAQWYLAGSSLEHELADIGRSVAGEQPVAMLVAIDGDRPIGWCQWYLCADDPEWAAEIGAADGDVGIDYAIGEPAAVGRGVGTELVAALVRVVRAAHPSCGIVADPEAHNAASRRVLEKNGFALAAVTAMDSEPTDEPMAIYRLAGNPPGGPDTTKLR
jgi:RimJ/RimL family protein N-acetyltransferase